MSFQAEYIVELTSLLRDPDPARLRLGLDALTYSPAPSELLPEILTLALFHPTPEIRQQAGQVLQTSISDELYHIFVHAAPPLATTCAETSQEDAAHTLLTSLLACPQIEVVRLYEASLPYIPDAWEKMPLSTLLKRSQPLFMRRCRDLVQQRRALDLSHCHLRELPEQISAIPDLQKLESQRQS